MDLTPAHESGDAGREAWNAHDLDRVPDHFSDDVPRGRWGHGTYLLGATNPPGARY